MSSLHFTTAEVTLILSSLDPSKAIGSDGIGPRVLKPCAVALADPLLHLFSTFISTYCIPSEGGLHCITPIFKSGDKSSVTNYRPVSLLSSTSKVMEKLVYDKLIQFISPFLSNSQFGFLKGRSTLHQLLIFLSDIFSNIDNKLQTDAIYLDLRKAFDSVPHDKLLFKLHSFGITGELWLWLKAYLSSRTQCVCINDTYSDTLPVTSGVPQGSILGPLLFLIYINDVPSLVKIVSVLLYADDTKCYHPISNVNNSYTLQNDLNDLHSWSMSNISFNNTKSFLIQFTLKSSPIPTSYHINNTNISTIKICAET